MTYSSDPAADWERHFAAVETAEAGRDHFPEEIKFEYVPFGIPTTEDYIIISGWLGPSYLVGNAMLVTRDAARDLRDRLTDWLDSPLHDDAGTPGEEK